MSDLDEIKSPELTPLAEAMTPEPVTISPDSRAVLIPVDRRVELIVAADRNQGQHALAAPRQVRILGKTRWSDEIP
jgi:hypothetical protein